MIKRLQKRFILVSISSVFLVLFILMIILNCINYYNIGKNADRILDTLASNNGEFVIPDKPFTKPGDISLETPYETRYFLVVYDISGDVKYVNTTKIAAVDVDGAISYAEKVMDIEKERGYIDRYRYLITNNTDEKLLIFVDCSKQLNTYRDFLQSSIVVSCIALFAILFLVIIFSKKAIAPIALSYEKQKKFITDSSHELKTPLTIINANNEIIELEYGKNEYTEVISKQVNRLTMMTKNLTLLSKIGENEFTKEVANFSITDATFDVSENIRKTIESTGKKYNVDIYEKLEYKGNERLIRQLIYILLDNANKYSESYVNLKLYKVKNNIVLEVINDSSQIEKGNLIHYCDRFYRSDLSRASNIEGSGIGLSIVKEIVTAHKAKLNIYSEDGINIIIQVIF